MPRRKMLEPRCVSTSTKLSQMEHQQFIQRCDEDNVVPSQLLRRLVRSYSVGGVSASELEGLQIRHWLTQAPSQVRDWLTKTPNLEGE
jgi:hypothetical protein